MKKLIVTSIAVLALAPTAFSAVILNFVSPPLASGPLAGQQITGVIGIPGVGLPASTTITQTLPGSTWNISFNAGPLNINSANATGTDMSLTTDAAGNVVGWDLNLGSNVLGNVGDQIRLQDSSNPLNRVQINNVLSLNNGQAAALTQTVIVPEPSSALIPLLPMLLATSLYRRRK